MTSLAFRRLAFSRRSVFSMILGCTLLPSPMPASLRQVRAVLLDASKDAHIRHAGTNTFIDAKSGAELIEGDTLRTGSEPASLLACDGAENDSNNTIYAISAGSQIDFGAAGLPLHATSLPATSGANPDLPQSPCTIPIDDRAMAADIDEPRIRENLKGSWTDRVPQLSEQGRTRLYALMGPIEDRLKTNAKDLSALIARAYYLENAGLAADAALAYQTIYATYPAAAWASRSSSRMMAQILPLADIATVIPPLEPPGVDTTGLRAKRAVGDQANAGTGTVIAPKGEIYALLVDLSDYPKTLGVENLQYAERDAELFQKYLESARGGRARHIALIRSAEGTAARIRRGLEELVAGHASPNNTLIIFISAHGYYGCVDANGIPIASNCPDFQSEPILLTTDTSSEGARSTGIPMRTLQRLITKNAYRFGRVLLYIDVCHAGVIRWDRRASAPPPDAIKINFEPRLGVVGLMLASSVSADKRDLEYAYESDQLGHGIFTFYVVAGLAGGAPSSGNVVLFSDLFDHVKKQVSDATGHLQEPFLDYSSQRIAVVDDIANKDFPAPMPVVTDEKIIPRKRAKGRDAWASPLPENSGVPGGQAPLPVSDGLPSSDEREAFEASLKAGLLLPDEDGSAYQLFRRLEPQLGENERFLLRNRLRTALEDGGQQVLLAYIQGDQIPQKKPAFERGAKLFRAALDLAPGTAFNESRMLFCQGRVAVFDKNYVTAQKLLESAIRLDPSHGYAYNGLGIALLEQLPEHSDYLATAIAAFQDAHQLEPSWTYPLHNAALAWAQQGRDQEAIDAYQSAMRIAPAYPYLPYNLGLLHQRRNEFEFAEENFRLALKRAESRARRLGVAPATWAERAAPLTALGAMYLNEGRARLAAKQFEAALRADRDYVPALHNQAVLLSTHGKRLRAIEIWRQALALDPEYMPARLSLAESLIRGRDPDGAEREYREILARKANYPAAHRELALILAGKGECRPAIAELDVAIKAAPSGVGLAAEREDLEKLLAGNAPVTAAIRKAVGRQVCR